MATVNSRTSNTAQVTIDGKEFLIEDVPSQEGWGDAAKKADSLIFLMPVDQDFKQAFSTGMGDLMRVVSDPNTVFFYCTKRDIVSDTKVDEIERILTNGDCLRYTIGSPLKDDVSVIHKVILSTV